MKNKIEFIKLLTIAILCDALIIIGYLLIKLSYSFHDYELAASSAGMLILIYTTSYVAQYRLKQMQNKIITLVNGATIHVRR